MPASRLPQGVTQKPAFSRGAGGGPAPSTSLHPSSWCQAPRLPWQSNHLSGVRSKQQETALKLRAYRVRVCKVWLRHVWVDDVKTFRGVVFTRARPLACELPHDQPKSSVFSFGRQLHHGGIPHLGRNPPPPAPPPPQKKPGRQTLEQPTHTTRSITAPSASSEATQHDYRSAV